MLRVQANPSILNLIWEEASCAINAAGNKQDSKLFQASYDSHCQQQLPKPVMQQCTSDKLKIMHTRGLQ